MTGLQHTKAGHRRIMRRFSAALAAVLWTAGSLTACGSSSSRDDANGVSIRQPEGPTVSIGVASDQPGLGVWHNGGYSGFDVDVARYVAKALGYADKQIVFKPVTPRSRVSMLESAQVDMVVSSFGITERHESAVTMTGPYLIVRQDLLVRAADAGDITGIKDMNGRKACVVAGSDVTDAVRSQAPKASIEERDDYGQCLTSLLIGDVDAVAAGDAILTGLATVKGNGYVQVVGAPFGEERYGIAVKHGNTQLADSIDDILSDMIGDGTWRQAVRGMRRQIGYTVDSKLNPPDPAASSDTASSDPEQGDE